MIKQMHPLDVKALLDAGEPVVLVDVRQPYEHEYCRLDDSILIPLGELSEHASEIDPPDNATIVVYCHHGVRSLSGAAILQNAGFANAVSMAGGIDAWTTFVDPRVPRY